MLDENKVKNVLTRYKKDFDTEWNEESYKWLAIKNFQDNWNIDAPDFHSMLKKSLAKANNLLSARNYYATGMILSFAEENPESVRNAFRDLFDESKDISDRIDDFRDASEEFIKVNGANNSFQDLRAITVYLWLMYPDKYYIYKTNVVKKSSEYLASDIHFIQGRYLENQKNLQLFYDEINAIVKKDPDLRKMLNEKLTSDCYFDPELKTLTSDICIYITKMSTNAEEDQPVLEEANSNSYTKQEFLSEVYLDSEKYDSLVAVLRNKKNIILQGAPGVGKTFAAKRLSYSLMGTKDDNRIEMIQFHQNYSYEDFVMGYKPTDERFELRYGLFYKFCKKAENDPSNEYFFIIDEINRGNMSKIFGELLMLIENHYRGTELTLAYDGKPFSVPKNLYLIGMMNTADRSLAMIDYALRRRFSFFEMEPAFDNETFKKYQASLENPLFDSLIQEVKYLNDEISKDKALGNGFLIGHSYFCEATKETCTTEWMKSIVEYDIFPMLSEYWFDDEERVASLKDRFRRLF